jgi:hypothetical protein
MNIDLHVRHALRVSLLLAFAAYIVVNCAGCGAMEKFTDDHPQAVVVVEIGALAVGGVMMGRAIAHSAHTDVHATPQISKQCASNYAECVR